MGDRSRHGLAVSRIFSIIVATLLVAGVVVAVSTFFEHKFPAVSLSAGLSTTCPSPSSLSANETLITAGTDGYIRYTCGTNPAFSSLADALGTPVYNLTGTVFRSLYIFKHSTPAGTTCPNGDSSIQLSNGNIVSFPANSGTDWDYCARYVAASLGATTSFTITWSA